MHVCMCMCMCVYVYVHVYVYVCVYVYVYDFVCGESLRCEVAFSCEWVGEMQPIYSLTHSLTHFLLQVILCGLKLTSLPDFLSVAPNLRLLLDVNLARNELFNGAQVFSVSVVVAAYLTPSLTYSLLSYCPTVLLSRCWLN